MFILFLSLRPCLMRNARLSDCKIVSIHLNPDKSEAFAHGCFTGASATHERVENHTARRRDKAAEISHQVGRLYGRVDVVAWKIAAAYFIAETVVTRRILRIKTIKPIIPVTLASLRTVEETRRRTKKLSRLIASVVYQVRWPRGEVWQLDRWLHLNMDAHKYRQPSGWQQTAPGPAPALQPGKHRWLGF